MPTLHIETTFQNVLSWINQGSMVWFFFFTLFTSKSATKLIQIHQLVWTFGAIFLGNMPLTHYLMLSEAWRSTFAINYLLLKDYTICNEPSTIYNSWPCFSFSSKSSGHNPRLGPPFRPILVSHFNHHLIDQLPTGAEWGCAEILVALQLMKTGSLSKQARMPSIWESSIEKYRQ